MHGFIVLGIVMENIMIKVGVNGYGTIGRRVAYAVSLQDDMEVTGIVKTRPDYVAKIASRKFRLYVPDSKYAEAFEKEGLRVEGTLEDLIRESDVITDATPGGIGTENARLYRDAGVKAIFQGGEDSDVAEASFNAYSNYGQSSGKRSTRVVSCNTTGLARTLYPVLENFGIKSARITVVRRATDPNDSKKGPINAIEPSLDIPSHHAPDLKTVLGDIDVETVAIKVPTTLMHVHSVHVETEKPVAGNDLINKWSGLKRIMLVSGKDGRKSTAQVMDMARELGRNRSDLYEIAVWKESVSVRGNTIDYIQAVHQESDVVPENVDAIRALMGGSRDESISKTDKSLGINGTVI